MKSGGQGEDFECLSPLPAEAVRVRFSGRCQGRAVLWDLHLQTLAHYRSERAAAGFPVPAPLRSFLEVFPEGGDGPWRVVVALDLPRIDAPAVRKTVIMLRNWRGLRPGRHEWGPPARMPADGRD